MAKGKGLFTRLLERLHLRPGVHLAMTRETAWKLCFAAGTEEGERESACSVVITAWDTDEDDRAGAYKNRGVIRMNRGDLAAAEADFAAAVDLRPASAELHSILGILRTQLGMLDDAIPALTKAIELDESDMEALVARSYAYLKTGRLEAVLEDCDEVLRRSPETGAALLNRGSAHAQLENYEAAERDLTDAIRLLVPANASAYYNRGILFETTNRFEAAIQDYRKAVELDPTHLRARQALEEVVQALGSIDSRSTQH